MSLRIDTVLDSILRNKIISLRIDTVLGSILQTETVNLRIDTVLAENAATFKMTVSVQFFQIFVETLSL